MEFFYRQQSRKFNYIPRYYDPAKEEWEKKKAENYGTLPEWHPSAGEKTWIMIDEVEVMEK